jgi:hypothetical protein
MSKRQILFFGSCLSVIMSLSMALAMTIINVGLDKPHFVSAWLEGGMIGFLVSLPLSFFVPSLIQKLMFSLKV